MRITGGELRGRVLPPLRDKNVRPTSAKTREALFNILRSEVGSIEGFNVLDLYAGTGLIGFEAISRGAVQSTEVDISGALLQTIEETAKKWGIANKVITKKNDIFNLCRAKTPSETVSKALNSEQNSFDLIYADPPFTEIYPDLRIFLPILSAKGFAVFEMPSRTLPAWANEAKKLRSYGESTLAIF